MTPTRFSVISLSFFLAACTASVPEDNGDALSSVSSSSSSSSISSVSETLNVSYKGTVEPAGISIYMEGTHRLALDDGRFILLESDAIDLNGYVEEEVEVFGAIRPTVEADAVIMSVEEIRLQRRSSASASSISSVSSQQPVSSVTVSSVSNQVSSVASAAQEVSSSAVAQASSPLQTSAELEARIEAMASVDPAAENWTQQYCTGHIGFCVPVHKNWWFKSFGVTDSDFWHVEMSSEEIDLLHSGPIAVRLVSGGIASANASDGQVMQQNGMVIGYRTWTDGRHFEIVADQRLEASVRYMTQNLIPYSEEE